MDFGHAIFLWGLPAVLLPIILHLFYKRCKQKTAFSTLMFFVKRQRYFAYRRKFFEILLLALRMLIILLLVLALARIFFKKYNFISGASTEAVIVLDDTASMSRPLATGNSAFELAKRKAEDVLNSLSGDDGAALIPVSGRKGINLTRDKSTVLKLLRKSRPSGTSGSLAAALDTAIEQLRKAPGVNREIYIISDFQEKLKPSRALSLDGLGNVRVYCLPLRTAGDNISVGSVTIDSTPKISGRIVSIPYTVVNHGKGDRDIDVELVIGGKKLLTRREVVKGMSSTTGHFLYTPVKPGRVNGYVQLGNVEPDLDNRAYFTFGVSGNIRVLFVTDRGTQVDPFFFFRVALDPSGNRHTNGIETVSQHLENLTAESFDDTHVVFCSSGIALPADKAFLLAKYVTEGGVLVSVPQSITDESIFHSLISASSFVLRDIYGKLSAFKQKGIVFEPPLNTLNDLLQLDLLEWKQIVNMKAMPSARVLARQDKAPLILEQSYGKGRWISFAFGLRRTFSNWPALKSYPVMAVAFTNYAAGNQERSVELPCGSTLELKNGNGNEGIGWSSTNGGYGKLTAGIDGKYILSNTYSPGVISLQGADYQAAVLNTDKREADSKLLPDTGIKGMFDSSVTLLDPAAGIAEQVVQLRRGTDLSGPLLLLMLLLMALEFMLGGNGSMMKQALKKRKRTTAAVIGEEEA